MANADDPAEAEREEGYDNVERVDIARVFVGFNTVCDGRTSPRFR